VFLPWESGDGTVFSFICKQLGFVQRIPFVHCIALKKVGNSMAKMLPRCLVEASNSGKHPKVVNRYTGCDPKVCSLLSVECRDI